MAMNRRPRPIGGRHPPPLAPTVSTFKPRAEWSKADTSMFLYVNLPGFYKDQIIIKSDEKTRTIQIQGERPLSTQTRARFNEYYRVPESCDMNNIKTSFLHGLLTIELPIILVSEKRVQDPAKDVPSKDHEKLAETGQEKSGQKGKEEDKTVAAMGQGRSEEMRLKEEKGRTSTAGGGLERKKPVEDKEKHVEKKGVAEMGQTKSEQKMKEEGSRMPVGDGRLGRKKQEKDGKWVGDAGRQEMKQREERKREVDGALGSKQPKKEEKLVEEKASEGQIQDQAKQKKQEGDSSRDVAAGETRGLEKDEELRKPDSEDPMKTTKAIAVESETVRDAVSVVDVKDQREINGDRKLSYADDLRKNLLKRMDEEQLQKHGKSLVNVGVAALVIMGLGAYLFTPFLKLFY